MLARKTPLTLGAWKVKTQLLESKSSISTIFSLKTCKEFLQTSNQSIVNLEPIFQLIKTQKTIKIHCLKMHVFYEVEQWDLNLRIFLTRQSTVLK